MAKILILAHYGLSDSEALNFVHIYSRLPAIAIIDYKICRYLSDAVERALKWEPDVIIDISHNLNLNCGMQTAL